MTESQMMKYIAQQCEKVGGKIKMYNYLNYLEQIDSLEMRGCIALEFKRNYAVITYLKDMPINAVGIIDESDEKTHDILEMLKSGCLMKEIARKHKISMNKISECKRHLTNQGVI